MRPRALDNGQPNIGDLTTTAHRNPEDSLVALVDI